MNRCGLQRLELEVNGVGESTSLVAYPAEKPRATLILAHGAGAGQTHPWMVAMSKLLAARGLDVVTFNFLYREAGRRFPDKKEILERTWLAVIEAVKACAGERPLYLGGKSMGGRIATQVAAAQETGAKGIVLLGYPLHPPDKPEQLRDGHLGEVKAPMLFIQGSRDEFGTPDELAPYLKRMKEGSRIFAIEGADHSLATRKKSGAALEQTMARVADEIDRFTAAPFHLA